MTNGSQTATQDRRPDALASGNSTLYEKIAKGLVPKPVKLDPNGPSRFGGQTREDANSEGRDRTSGRGGVVVKRKGPGGCDAGPLKANVKSAPYSALASQTQSEDQIPSVSAPKSGGQKSRDKGNRAERALVRFFQYHGFGAERVPLLAPPVAPMPAM